MREPGAQILLKASDEGVVLPAGLGEEALEDASGNGQDFGEVLGVATLGRLDQQSLEIVPTPFATLPTPEERGEGGVEGAKRLIDPLELFQVQRQPPEDLSSSPGCLITLIRRCNTSTTP